MQILSARVALKNDIMKKSANRIIETAKSNNHFYGSTLTFINNFC